MEDALSLQGHFQGREDVDFFGLFDGHAGRGVAEYCADHVHTVVLDKLKGGSDTQAALKDCWVNVNSGLKVVFLETRTRTTAHTHIPADMNSVKLRPNSMAEIRRCGMRARPRWLRWSRDSA